MTPDKDKKIKEPYSPENTPPPPQIIDPSRKKERNENEKPVEGGSKKEGPQKSKDHEQQPDGSKRKLLGESPIEIDDETTI